MMDTLSHIEVLTWPPQLTIQQLYQLKFRKAAIKDCYVWWEFVAEFEGILAREGTTRFHAESLSCSHGDGDGDWTLPGHEDFGSRTIICDGL
jgi:hypothetical protein